MRKKHLDNAYNNILKDEFEIFSLTLPISIIYKSLYNKIETLLQSKYNLIHSEIDVLAALFFNKKVLSPTELYDATIFSSGGMTKVLKKLEEKKLIKRVPSDNDKRSKLVKIEPKGEKLLQESLKEIIKTNNKIFSVLDEKEKKELREIFKKLVYSFIEE